MRPFRRRLLLHSRRRRRLENHHHAPCATRKTNLFALSCIVLAFITSYQPTSHAIWNFSNKKRSFKIEKRKNKTKQQRARKENKRPDDDNETVRQTRKRAALMSFDTNPLRAHHQVLDFLLFSVLPCLTLQLAAGWIVERQCGWAEIVPSLFLFSNLQLRGPSRKKKK